MAVRNVITSRPSDSLDVRCNLFKGVANAVAFEVAGSAESAERNRFVVWCEETSLRVLSEPKGPR